MPSERYMRLPAEKKEAIRQAGLNEFLKVSYDKASINKIIQEAKISRGSFYTYFEDKYDFLTEILESIGLNADEKLIDLLKEFHGDLWYAYEKFYDYFIEFSVDNNLIQLLKNINSYDEAQRYFMEKHSTTYMSSEYRKRVKQYYNLTNMSDFISTDIESYILLHELVCMLIMTSLAEYYNIPADRKKLRKKFIGKLNIIRYGVSKHGREDRRR